MSHLVANEQGLLCGVLVFTPSSGGWTHTADGRNKEHALQETGFFAKVVSVTNCAALKIIFLTVVDRMRR